MKLLSIAFVAFAASANADIILNNHQLDDVTAGGYLWDGASGSSVANGSLYSSGNYNTNAFGSYSSAGTPTGSFGDLQTSSSSGSTSHSYLPDGTKKLWND